MAFGTVGPDVRLIGTAYGGLIRRHPSNAVIVNICSKDYAMRAAMSSMIRTSTSCGPQTCRASVSRRMRSKIAAVSVSCLFFMRRLETSPTSANDPAHMPTMLVQWVFVLSQGYTLVWSLWGPPARRAHQSGHDHPGPYSDGAGKPIVDTYRDEFVFGTRLPATRLTGASAAMQPTPPWSSAEARLTVRWKEADLLTHRLPDLWAYGDTRIYKTLARGHRRVFSSTFYSL